MLFHIRLILSTILLLPSFRFIYDSFHSFLKLTFFDVTGELLEPLPGITSDFEETHDLAAFISFSATLRSFRLSDHRLTWRLMEINIALTFLLRLALECRSIEFMPTFYVFSGRFRGP
jgi:hypothetical protein